LNRKAGLGVVVSGPFEKVGTFASLTPYDFFSLRYGNADSQFKATLSGSLEVWREMLFIGAGVSFFMSSSGAADARILSSNPTGRLQLEMSLNSAVLAGAFWKTGATAGSLVFRQSVSPSFVQSVTGSAELGNGTGTVDIPFLMTSSLYFEPQAIEGEVQHDFGPLKASAGMSYQLWGSYRPPSVRIEALDANRTIRATEIPPLSLRNTWNPRASLDLPLARHRTWFSLGYQFRPTPLTDLSGPANLVDSDTHVVGLSFRHAIPSSEVFPLPLTLGLFGQVHFFSARKITKATETIGAPGYDLDGNSYIYGANLQLSL
jgi:hypothetical protein